MDTYLLDTNIVSVLYDARRPNHSAVRQMIGGLSLDAPQLVSVITIAELRFGLALSEAAGQTLTHIEACIQQAEQHALADISRHTATAFAQVKSSIARQRVNLGSRIPRWVEAWTDRVTGQSLQIDEHDLWIAAQALERNYVVVTADGDFRAVIAPCVPDLRILSVSQA